MIAMSVVKTFSLLILLNTLVVYGWNSEAHKLVGKLTAKLLSRKAARFVKSHLPMDESEMHPKMTRIENILVSNSVWADRVAETADYKWSGKLHFGSIEDRNCRPFDLEKNCPNGRCIVTAIGNYTQRAADAALSLSERGEAIKFLIHLVADIHMPLHLGFESDVGGNLLYVNIEEHFGEDLKSKSLHEVWDAYLLDRTVPYWEMAPMLKVDKDQFRLRKEFVTVERAQDVAKLIATETIIRHTCESAYKNEFGHYIEPREALSAQYMRTRGEIAQTQLVKAAVRLAQIIEAVSDQFAISEFEAMQPQKAPVSSPMSDDNPFSILALKFDPEESVFDLEDPFGEIAPSEEESQPADTEDIDEEEEEPEVHSGGVSDVHIPTEEPEDEFEGPSAEEKKRIRNRKIRGRKQRKKRMFEGVDVQSLVLIKRSGQFYITYKENVVSDEYIPHMVAYYIAKFSGQREPRRFILDFSVFPTPQLSRELATRMFKHFGATECADSSEVFETGRGDNGIAGTSLNILTALSLDPSGRLKIEQVADEHVKQIYERPTAKMLRALQPAYGGRVPTEEEYWARQISQVRDSLILFELPSTFLISSYELLKAEPRKIKYQLRQVSINPTAHLHVRNAIFGFIDTRVYNGPISTQVLDALQEVRSRPAPRLNIKKLLKQRQIPLIFDFIIGFSAFVNAGAAPHTLARLADTVSSIRSTRASPESSIWEVELRV
jgi:hypothetical protein